MMRRTLTSLLMLVLAAGLFGCTEESGEDPFDHAAAEGCLACHGDEDVLRDLLPETVLAARERSDGG